MGRWVPRASLGGFVVRFPHPDDPADTGWHLDGSFPSNRPDEPPPGSLFEWRINVRSRGASPAHALSVFGCWREGRADANSSGIAPAGPSLAGSSGRKWHVHAGNIETSRDTSLWHGRGRRHWTGGNGVFMSSLPSACGPTYGGLTPHFLAQPPLLLNRPLELTRSDGKYSQVEQAIRAGLSDRRPL